MFKNLKKKWNRKENFQINAWFTFLSRQHKTKWEWECEGCICLIFHTFDLLLSRLEALGDMSVNQSRVKGNEYVSNILPHYRWYSHEMWMGQSTHECRHSHSRASIIDNEARHSRHSRFLWLGTDLHMSPRASRQDENKSGEWKTKRMYPSHSHSHLVLCCLNETVNQATTFLHPIINL